MHSDSNKKFYKEYSSGVPISKSRPINPSAFKTDGDKHELIVAGFTFTEKDKLDEYLSYDTVIAIDDILKRDKGAFKTSRRCLEARGWCKIIYSEATRMRLLHLYCRMYINGLIQRI